MARDLLAWPAYAHPRRAPPRHALPIRPAGRPRATDHPIAARAPLSQQCDFVLAQGRARAALHQLAAGPVCQLPGAAALPREDARVQGHGGPGGGNGGVQPLRLLPGARGREHPVQLQQRCAAGAGALPGYRPDDTAGAGLSGQGGPQQAAHHRFPGQAQPAGIARHPLPDPHGTRRADTRGNAAKSQRLLPRLRLAAGAAAAPAGGGGGVDKAEVEFSHEMRVTRIFESPRVTKPYTEAQWRAVLALGERVDADLVAGDVRLTMGGEPTFVAVGDRDAPEWNTDALGPTKRGFATELVHKLRAEYGQGGFLHFGQGKWYPGEQLPRWALSICWRADGKPAWQNPALFADERNPSHYTSADAGRFVRHLTRKLGITDRYIQPGYEDTFYYLWRERRLPVNVDPFDARLDDELERARLRRVFEQKLDSVVGYVLPLQAGEGAGTLVGSVWSTGPWFFRDDRMLLIPGDSPMGYRLPLD